MPVSAHATLDSLLALMRPWPKSWSYDKQDLAAGARLVAEFESFIRHLHGAGLAPRTIRRHVDNLWVLGNELIRDSHMTDPPEPIPPLVEVVEDEGGPLLLRTECENDQREFDATCKKLYRFLTAPIGTPAPRPKRSRRPIPRAVQHVDDLIAEAITDAHDHDEQVDGFLACLEEHVSVPFTTTVLGATVSVSGFEAGDEGQIAAVCRRGKHKQRLAVGDLPLPTPPPVGHEWIAAYRRWSKGR